MSDDRDILGKADALLRRHVPPRAESVDDVPVLTELITSGAAPSGRPDPAVARPPDAPPPGSLPPEHAPPQHHAEDDGEQRRQLVSEVVNAVQARLAGDFERRLAQHLANEIHASVAAALDDLQQDIANAVGDAVAQALARRDGK